jgi:predicted membrane chloride channel (bestrophin family)
MDKSIGMVKFKSRAGQLEDSALPAITPRLRELVEVYHCEQMKSTLLLLALSVSLAAKVEAAISCL